MSLRALRLVPLLAVLTAVSCSSGGSRAAKDELSTAAKASVSAYCSYFLAQGQKLHDEFTSADAAGQANPLGSLLVLLGAPGQLATFFDGLSSRAPDDIQGDVETLATAFHQEVSNVGQDVTDPVAGLVSGLASGATSAAAFQRVNAYTTANCPGVVAAAAPDQSSSAASPSGTTSGLVLATCTPPSQVTIDFLDPSTGAQLGEHPFLTGTSATANVACGGTPDNDRAPAGPLRMEFDANYDRLAVSIPAHDSGTDVGYVTSTGQVTDVSPQPSGNTDFTAASHDSLASFQPDSANLWFQHGDNVVSVDTSASGPAIVNHANVKFGDDTGVDGTGRYHLPPGVPVDATGTRWVNATENPYVIQVWRPGDVLEGNFTQGVPLATYAMPRESFDCEPSAWITEKSWLCDDGAVATVGAHNVLTITSPIPAVDGRSNFDFVLSPDRTQEAFQSCRSDVCSIYTVGLTGGTPVKVVDNPNALTSTLVEWRS
ncbi:MAG: hypothetical protein JWO22_1231 [Frankiales bacterium]|nr:hypothetical protein [Frankiales bacterium]